MEESINQWRNKVEESRNQVSALSTNLLVYDNRAGNNTVRVCEECAIG